MQARQSGPWPYFPPRAPQYDVNVQVPAPPPPAVSLWEYRTFPTAALNDDTLSPLDQQYGTRYPGTNRTRAIDVPKPPMRSVLVPVVDQTMWRPTPGRSKGPAPVDQYRENGQLGLVWTDPETGEQKPVDNLKQVSEYIRAVQGI